MVIIISKALRKRSLFEDTPPIPGEVGAFGVVVANASAIIFLRRYFKDIRAEKITFLGPFESTSATAYPVQSSNGTI